jgi:hypothetical protein
MVESLLHLRGREPEISIYDKITEPEGSCPSKDPTYIHTYHNSFVLAECRKKPALCKDGDDIVSRLGAHLLLL